MNSDKAEPLKYKPLKAARLQGKLISDIGCELYTSTRYINCWVGIILLNYLAINYNPM